MREAEVESCSRVYQWMRSELTVISKEQLHLLSIESLERHHSITTICLISKYSSSQINFSNHEMQTKPVKVESRINDVLLRRA